MIKRLINKIKYLLQRRKVIKDIEKLESNYYKKKMKEYNVYKNLIIKSIMVKARNHKEAIEIAEKAPCYKWELYDNLENNYIEENTFLEATLFNN